MPRITTPILAGAVAVSAMAVPAVASAPAQAKTTTNVVGKSAGGERPKSLKGARTSVKRARTLERQAQASLTALQQQIGIAAATQTMADAQAEVALAQSRVNWAKRWLLNTKRMKHAAGPGSFRVAAQCRAAGVPMTQCRVPRWGERHLKYDTVVIGRTVEAKFHKIKIVGGWRPSDPYPDHPSGRAADIMMPHAGYGKGHKLGNQIARYFQRHARQYGIKYMIWRQRYWTTGSRVGAWRHMGSRGSRTANHMDHVHITVRTGHSGWALKKALRKARAAAGADKSVVIVTPVAPVQPPAPVTAPVVEVTPAPEPTPVSTPEATVPAQPTAAPSPMSATTSPSQTSEPTSTAQPSAPAQTTPGPGTAASSPAPAQPGAGSAGQ